MRRAQHFIYLLAISIFLPSASYAQERPAQPLSAEQARGLKAKSSFKECSNCPEMVVVPAGSFLMGSPVDEPSRETDEGPQHTVAFAVPFAVGKFSVTFDEWDACVSAGDCRGHKPDDAGWGRGRMPVVNISWTDAQSYITWLSKTTGRSYRLPSEAEREYVTRAGSKTAFWMGPRISTDDANFYFDPQRFGLNLTGENRAKPLPVDGLRPNPWGLHHVHGNVWEWVDDCWHADYSGAPIDGSSWTAGGECKERVSRGGCWACDAYTLRSAVRAGRAVDERKEALGFRVARSLKP